MTDVVVDFRCGMCKCSNSAMGYKRSAGGTCVHSPVGVPSMQECCDKSQGQRQKHAQEHSHSSTHLPDESALSAVKDDPLKRFVVPTVLAITVEQLSGELDGVTELIGSSLGIEVDGRGWLCWIKTDYEGGSFDCRERLDVGF